MRFVILILLLSINLSAQITHEEFVRTLKSAVNGDALSQSKLGDFFGCGNEFTQSQNNVEALKWYRKAADLGDPESKNYVGFYYMQGWGTDKDIDEAFKWWRDAANDGNVTALYNIAWCYEHDTTGVAKNLVEAYAYYMLAGKSIYATRAKTLGFKFEMTSRAACFQMQQLEYLMTPQEILAAKVRSKEIIEELKPRFWQIKWWKAFWITIVN